MRFTAITAASAALLLSACATSYQITPHATSGQTVRYFQGQPTIVTNGEHGSLQVALLPPNEKGRLLYSVAAYNDSDEPATLGVENMTLTAAGESVRIFTVPELERMAKNDATTAAVLVALAGGVAAAAAAQSPTSTSTLYTPRGVYRTETTNRALQSLAVTASAAQTSTSIANIGSALDATLANLGQNVLQTTTIDPNSSFGGQVVGDRVSIPGDGVLETTLRVTFAGEEYEVNFGISTVK